MTSPVTFETTTPRHSLAMLAAGQTQKEFFVNEAFSRIDALLHPAVEGEADTPPAAPSPGECWLVADPAIDAWHGHGKELACWDGIQWTYCSPVDGMQILDRSSGGRLFYRDGWVRAARPPSPDGGAVVDVEARAAIDAIVDILATVSIFPDN